ncbi:hypothetical protein [Pseudodesulfovibrio pelocollis]|uniref:hypothetical protein n=1 Tax=Pseudodesulfovibrio pelocollis TaxID=3051432 RepID=UPI00255ACE3E|nr:hypothetical protein [Pseudodesulfovibrio sp. SB368]
MQFTVINNKIVTTMKACLGLIAPRDPFNLARLTTEAGSIEFNCANMKVFCSAKIPATVETFGVACVDLKTIYNVLSKLPMDVDITFALETGERSELVISQGRRRYKLPVSNQHPEFFDATPFPEEEAFLDEEHAISKALDKVKPYVSSEESLEAISCVLLRGEGNRLSVVGLNGHQFARVSQETEFTNILNGDSLVGLRGLQEIKGWLGNGKETEYAFDEKRIFFRQSVDGIVTTFSMLLSSYQYPHYGNFIARVQECEKPVKLICDRAEMIDAINRLSIFATDNNRQVLFKIDTKTGEFIMFNSGSETGNGVEPLEVAVDGTLPPISFPAAGLSCILNTFSSNKVCLTITGSESPCLVVGMDDLDNGVETILMPMMVQKDTYYCEEAA